MDIQYKSDEGMFNCRVVGICNKDNKTLLSKMKTDKYWTFVGGKAMFWETTEETVLREYKEELGVDLQIERLLAVVENFFELAGRRWHQYIFFYLLKDSDNQLQQSEEEQEALDNKNVIYKWFELDDLNNIEIKPDCSKSILENIPEQIIHLVNREK